jgi:hypothetical protein
MEEMAPQLDEATNPMPELPGANKPEIRNENELV